MHVNIEQKAYSKYTSGYNITFIIFRTNSFKQKLTSMLIDFD